MQEHQSARTGPMGLPRWSTPSLGIVGSSLFVSGLFVLVTAGQVLPWLTYFFVLGAALLFTLPVLVVTVVVAVSEAVFRRAWANGLRPLDRRERAPRATLIRALRYASLVWLANGAAIWLAAVVGQL